MTQNLNPWIIFPATLFYWCCAILYRKCNCNIELNKKQFPTYQLYIQLLRTSKPIMALIQHSGLEQHTNPPSHHNTYLQTKINVNLQKYVKYIFYECQNREFYNFFLYKCYHLPMYVFNTAFSWFTSMTLFLYWHN